MKDAMCSVLDLDSLVDAEERSRSQGLSEGLCLGEERSRELGLEEGRSQGESLGSEVGFYAAWALVWGSLSGHQPIKRQAGKLLSSCLSFPSSGDQLGSVSGDADLLRARFKILSTALKERKEPIEISEGLSENTVMSKWLLACFNRQVKGHT
ncbi:Hypothetical protein FKW44_000095 [Caligus rogercresseyi]|uniref:Essential protein Yae1 N-terminal domain-containing protein n=1 Tax=Caligus rogercresseyi TaxID=217165 RepID=A0A7T8KGZ7_CALRO|nr:Hypothetical protein FKW44_000095 [Caligus rogercresseyi]